MEDAAKNPKGKATHTRDSCRLRPSLERIFFLGLFFLYLFRFRNERQIRSLKMEYYWRKWPENNAQNSLDRALEPYVTSMAARTRFPAKSFPKETHSLRIPSIPDAVHSVHLENGVSPPLPLLFLLPPPPPPKKKKFLRVFLLRKNRKLFRPYFRYIVHVVLKVICFGIHQTDRK